MKPKLDCRLFRGDKPCLPTVGGRPRCDDCADYAPMGTRVCIIKLDAIGDVARTTCLLPALAKQHDPMHVTWLAGPESVGLLRGNEMIDVLLPYGFASIERLRVERFDLLLCLDKTARACAVGEQVRAAERRGFGLSEFGTVYPLNADAEYAFLLGISDEFKFKKNERTYQDVIFEAAGLRFDGEGYSLPLAKADEHFAEVVWEHVAPDDVIIGLNLGGGAAFAHKMWNAARCREFAQAAVEQVPHARVFLFGAEREREKMAAVAEDLVSQVVPTGTQNTLGQFHAMLARCDVVVTGDSLGMHLALASRRPTVILFGPTCAQEIETYGFGEKIVSPVDCAPCYRPRCDRSPSCMDAITAQDVVDAVQRRLKAGTPE